MVFSIGSTSSEESEEKDRSKHKRRMELQLENIDKKIEGRKDIAWWVSRYFKLHSLNYMVETHNSDVMVLCHG